MTATRRTLLGDLPVDETTVDRLDHALASTRDAFAVERRMFEAHIAALLQRASDLTELLEASGKAQRLRNRRDAFRERLIVQMVGNGNDLVTIERGVEVTVTVEHEEVEAIVAAANAVVDRTYPEC